jgi:hypothetical protein
MTDLSRMTEITVSTKSTEPLTGVVELCTTDEEIKFEITAEMAHKICTDLERFLTR